VVGREKDQISKVIHEINLDAFPAKVALYLTSHLKAQYERYIAQELATKHRIKHKPPRGKMIPKWRIDGIEQYPGPYIERIRVGIGDSTGFYPAESRARNQRVLKIAAKFSEQRARREE
jgi:hypothetical protein